MPALVECVPNFSEGRDRAVIDAIAEAIRGVSGVKLLDVDPGADTNRTVYTFVGDPDAVSEAAFRAAGRGIELIDMSRHKGAHPRIGSMDVCPFVPVSDITMDACAELARALGRRVADAHRVPVYFYEHAASCDERRSLAAIRAGEYEGLARKLADPAWAPDAGPAEFHPRAGAFVVGAREFLLAYNVNLNTTDRRLANEIALTIREGGRLKRDARGDVVVDAAGQQVRVPGRLKAVRAIGWYIEEYRQAQVSINLLDFRTTPLHVVFETVREEADRLGLVVTGSELVGLTPLAPMLEAGRHFLRKQGKSTGVPERDLVATAIQSLGLAQVAPFDAAKKIIEYQFRGPEPLAGLSLRRFADEVSTDSPAPGGGSVAALAGALAAALAAMVANLTVGKKGYETGWAPASQLAERAQRVKDALVGAIDADTAAFNRVLEATRLPRATPDQQAARQAAIQAAWQGAARVPLDTARLCAEAAGLARDIARNGNRASASDAGVGAVMARAGSEGAALNVLINLGSIEDASFRASAERAAADAVAEARHAAEEALAAMNGTLAAPVAWLPSTRTPEPLKP
jgi:glutamate formiminotransferase/formiminotetrahydrofolate cyclodeaminase